MDAEFFLAWMDAVGTLMREQRQKAFMTIALREAEADDDLVAGDAVCKSAMAEALMVTATVLGDEMQSLSVAPWLPMRIGGKLDALTTAARSRVETRGCPHCDGKEVWPWGYAHGLPRYRCTECRRTFNALSGTSLARLRHKDRWSAQAQALIVGESIAKAASRCGVAYTTAFRWRHRFLVAPALDKPTRLNGIVEADETFILESFKGRRADLPRAARTRGGKPIKTGLSAEQIPVLLTRDRAGATIDAVLPKLDRVSVTAVLSGVMTPDNQLCIDGGKAIAVFARLAGIPYHVLPKPGGPKPDAPELHIDSVVASPASNLAVAAPVQSQVGRGSAGGF